MKNYNYKTGALKNIVLTILLLGVFATVQAQDVIYINKKEVRRHPQPQPTRLMKNGAVRENYPEAKMIMGQVTEVTNAFLFYKKSSDDNGTLYATPVVNIDSVVFANGMVQRFTKEYRMPEHKRKERAEYANLGSNILSGSFGVFTHRIRFLSSDVDDDFTPFITTAISYEKIFLNNRLGVEVAPFVAFNKKGYGGTLYARFYAKNHGRFRMGMGPFYKLYVRDKTERYFNSTDGYNVDFTYQTAMSVLGFGISLQNNIDRNWVVTFSPSIGGVVGYTNRNQKKYGAAFSNYDRGLGMGELRLSLGYRF